MYIIYTHIYLHTCVCMRIVLMYMCVNVNVDTRVRLVGHFGMCHPVKDRIHILYIQYGLLVGGTVYAYPAELNTPTLFY